LIGVEDCVQVKEKGAARVAQAAVSFGCSTMTSFCGDLN
jgi:hypothetical protein